MTPQYKAMMKKLRSNTVKETTQATRNIRKYKRKIETAPKGRIVTDDYGNKLSVKKKTDGTFGRRHTLSQGVKRAIRLGGDNVTDELKKHAERIKNHDIYRKGEKGVPAYTQAYRHSTSAVRRLHAADAFTKRGFKNTKKIIKDNMKADYHSNRHDPSSSIHKTRATELAKNIHGTKRKPKDFTK